jgi:hypothetical protein
MNEIPGVDTRTTLSADHVTLPYKVNILCEVRLKSYDNEFVWFMAICEIAIQRREIAGIVGGHERIECSTC